MMDGLPPPPDIWSKGVAVEMSAAETEASYLPCCLIPSFLPLTAAVWQPSKLLYFCFRVYQTFLLRDLVLRKKTIPICRLLFLTPEVCFWPRLIFSLCCPTSQIFFFVQLNGKEREGVFK